MKTMPLFLLVALTGFLMVISCKYDEVLPPEPDPGEIISFSEDIIPIFNTSCNFSGCHNGAGPAPDLRAGTAYEALFAGTYIDTLQPPNSELYLWMNGERDQDMPPQGTIPANVATVILWIEQGAKNN